MRLPKLIAGRQGRARFAALALAAVSLAACAAAFAQSGRRTPRPQEIAPVPTPTPEPTPLPKDDKPEVKIPLAVMADDGNTFYISGIDTVQSVAVARLRESRALEVAGDRGRGSRGQAIKRAKESANQHVLYFELRIDPRYERTVQRPPSEYVWVDYTVFEPGTGKRKTGGSVYLQRAYGPLGRVGLPSCYPTMTHDIEYALAGLEVAERVMESFSLPAPRRCG